VSGLNAVETQTEIDGSIRLGADEPERLADVLASSAPNATT